MTKQQLAMIAKELLKEANEMAYRLTAKRIDEVFDPFLITGETETETEKTFNYDEILMDLLAPGMIDMYKDIRLKDYDIRIKNGEPVLYMNDLNGFREILAAEDEFEIDYKLVRWLVGSGL